MAPPHLLEQTLANLKRRLPDIKQRLADIKPHLIRHQRVILAGAGGVAIAFAAVVIVLFAGLPNRDELRTLGEMPQATTLYDINKRPVFTIFREYRIELPLASVSPHLRTAVVAFEDQRFANHKGIDLRRILGAAWADILERRKAQGGSTITQQLARQTFLTREKRLWRKLREIALAIRIEGMYSKDEILELYLNKVYFGDGLYGAEAAARGYFGKSASDLDLAEAALLVGLINAPSVNAPTVSMSRAVARRALVLKTMYGQELITKEALERASQQKVALRDILRREEPHGQYFKEEVRQQLVKQFGWERLSEGGLKVYTTIDVEMQRAAEATIVKSLDQIEARRAARLARRPSRPEGPARPDPERLEAALVAMDPGTGEVRAMVGGRDFKASRFNRATQALRQPGSAFKPFVYAAALESGYTPSSLVTRLDEPINTLQGAWIPEDEHSSESTMTVRTALRTSSNRAAVRMLEQVGIAKTVDHARRLGMGTVPSVPSLALGSGEVTLMTMTSAYSTFADQGRLRTPILIRRVEDAEGKVLFEAKQNPLQVLSPHTAFLMTSMLSDVVNYGTAYRARQDGFKLPAAGKTGTTNDYVDAWFVGYTPNLATGVWIGFDKPRTIIAHGFAGELAVPLWAQFMKTATVKHTPDTFKPPQGVMAVNVCRLSGQLPGPACDRIITEYFTRGAAPTLTCEQHSFLAASGELVAVVPTGSPSYPTSPHAVHVAVPTASTVTPPQLVLADDVPRAQDEPRKKRGFWGKIFGRGDKDRKDDKSRDVEENSQRKQAP